MTEVTQLLQQADLALEAGELDEALDLLRQAHELQPDDPEIASRYAELQRRRWLEERLRQAETDYAAKLTTGRAVDARDALRGGLEALLKPETDLPKEAREVLQDLIYLGDQEERLALGREEHWQTTQDLLAQLGRLSSQNWAARRASQMADQWARLAHDVALWGIIASATQLGNLLEAYQGAITYMRAHPTDEEAIRQETHTRELLINRLNESANKRLLRAQEALERGDFQIALGSLMSIEEEFYAPAKQQFPGLLDRYDEVEQVRAEIRRLRGEIEPLVEISSRVHLLIEDARLAYLEGDYQKADKLLRQVRLEDPEEKVAPLQQDARDLQRMVERLRVEKATQDLEDALAHSQAVLAAKREKAYEEVLERLVALDVRSLDDGLVGRRDQMIERVREALVAFRERQTMFANEHMRQLIEQIQSAIAAQNFILAQGGLDSAKELFEQVDRALMSQVKALRAGNEQLREMDRGLAEAEQYLAKGAPVEQIETLLFTIIQAPLNTTVAQGLKKRARLLLAGVGMTSRGVEQVANRLLAMSLYNPRDKESWLRLHWLQTQQRLERAKDERDKELADLTREVKREARWWLIGSLVSATIAFGTFVYAVAALIQGAVPISYLTPLYTALPGVASALFFKQYAETNQRLDKQRDKIWQQTETYEAQEITRLSEMITEFLSVPDEMGSESGSSAR